MTAREVQTAESNLQRELPVHAIGQFCREWRVCRLSLFGSVLRDDFATTSDVDVLVDLSPDHGLSLWDWVEMHDQLKVVFGREVDLVERRSIRNPFRRARILATHRVLYAE